jgi:hypothetical protein
VEVAVYYMEAKWASVAWDLGLAEVAGDPEVPLGPSHPRPTELYDSAGSGSSAGLAKDCPTDFRSCSADATVWSLKINVEIIFASRLSQVSHSSLSRLSRLFDGVPFRR